LFLKKTIPPALISSTILASPFNIVVFIIPQY